MINVPEMNESQEARWKKVITPYKETKYTIKAGLN